MLWENEMPRNACTRARKPRKWHTQCNMAKMAYRMQYGLILTLESLSHTHIRGRWMKMKCLEMRAHGHANRGNGIRNANDMKIWYGLIPTWESLSHTHIRGRWVKMKCLEMPAHGHANRGNGIRNAIWLKWHANMLMEFQHWNVGKTAPKWGENTPDAWNLSRNANLGA